MGRRHPLLEETIVACMALAAIAGIVDLIYWASTGMSPWPFVVVAEAFAFGWALVLLVAASPSSRR